jgi:flagellar motor protein MotB
MPARGKVVSSQPPSWEISTKENSSKTVRFNHGLPTSGSGEGPYGVGAVIVAVLFVGVALFIEKLPNANEAIAPKVEITQALLPSMKVSTIIDNTLADLSAYRGVQETAKGLKVSLSVDELFKNGKGSSAKIPLTIMKDKVEDVLYLLGRRLLSENNKLVFQIIGHTDQVPVEGRNKGGYLTNFELGAAQASKVASLFSKAGILSRRIMVSSQGDGLPLLPAQKVDGSFVEKNLSVNRRIEILITRK